MGPYGGSQGMITGDEDDKIPVCVEVQLLASSTVEPRHVQAGIARFLEGRTIWYRDGPLDLAECEDPTVMANVASVNICDTDLSKHRAYGLLLYFQYILRIYVYQLNEEGPEDDDEGEEGVPSYRELVLPAADLSGQWEVLHYDTSIKQRLLHYASSALLFADRRVNANLVSWNRVVLLHGPPGTGKTSLCKALAQKLTIRLSDRYRMGQLVEVNAHSLFSKWFSESGKLVSRLFGKITELVEEEDNLVFVLIDEVESLTSARKAAVSGSEPSDAIRAVNALLTQLDQLRRFPNVMILTTSNITEAIDVAFVDRADIKAYIGPPSLAARYEMLRGSVQELSRAGIVAEDTSRLLLPYQEAEMTASGPIPMAAAARSVGMCPVGDATAMVTAMPAAKDWPSSMGPEFDRPMGHAGAPHCSATGSGQTAAFIDAAAQATAQAAQAGTLSQALLEAAAACDGLSGRSLRKLPFLAHAGAPHLPMPCPSLAFLRALRDAAQREQADRQDLVSG